jgi:hypothetical protein
MTETLSAVQTLWCDCDASTTADRDVDSVVAHEVTCLYGGDPKRKHLRARCRCWATPTLAQGSLTLNEHDEDCGFPLRRCENDEHRIWKHQACGRPVAMRFCGCTSSDHGFTLDIVRGWWVHYDCGWPSRTWFERQENPVPAGLEGVKPVTYHEYRIVPRSPKRPYDALSEQQRRWNDEMGGRWLWD